MFRQFPRWFQKPKSFRYQTNQIHLKSPARRRFYTLLGVTTATSVIVGFSWNQVQAEDKGFKMDMSYADVKRMLESFEKHRHYESFVPIVATTGLILGDIFFVTGTGFAGAAVALVACIAHIYENLQVVLPRSQWNSRLQRKRYIDVPPEMSLLLSMVYSHQIKDKSTLLSHETPEWMRCSRVGHQIASASKVNLPLGQEWVFHVIDEEHPNAFVFQGGQVFVTTSLLSKFDDEELAFVLAHEIGHVEARHIEERISIQRFPEVIKWSYRLLSFLGVFVLDTIVSTSTLIDVISNIALILPYSRIHEEEADCIALEYLVNASIHPEVALRVCEKFIELEKSGVTQFSFLSETTEAQIKDLLSTHPSWDVRKQSLAKELPDKIVDYERKMLRRQ